MTNRIMIINNSPDVLQAISNLLSLEGYSVFEGMYRQDVIVEIQRLKPNLLILDYAPPCETLLLSLFAQLKAASLDSIPVIVTTVGYDIPVNVSNFVKAQVPKVLIKPFGYGDLLKAVRAQMPTNIGW